MLHGLPPKYGGQANITFCPPETSLCDRDAQVHADVRVELLHAPRQQLLTACSACGKVTSFFALTRHSAACSQPLHCRPHDTL